MKKKYQPHIKMMLESKLIIGVYIRFENDTEMAPKNYLD